jgi:glucan phosphoethanolaminetransferase (alkaline phosphatase superfamily)
MKKLLKVLLPPCIGFGAYFLAIRFSSVYFTLRIDELGEGTIQSFMAYFRYFLPLLFTVAVLTQLLIVVPVWDRVFLTSKTGKVISCLLLCLICLLFAAGISYCIWDRQSSVYHVIKVCAFMTAVQLVYWAVNLFVLYFLTKKPEQLPQVVDQTDE